MPENENEKWKISPQGGIADPRDVTQEFANPLFDPEQNKTVLKKEPGRRPKVEEPKDKSSILKRTPEKEPPSKKPPERDPKPESPPQRAPTDPDIKKKSEIKVDKARGNRH